MKTIDKMTHDDIKALQEQMLSLGYYGGAVDGVWGPATAKAYQHYLTRVTRTTPEDVIVAPAAPKPWWTSITQNGALVLLLVTIAKMFDIDANVAIMESIISHGIELILALGILFGNSTRKKSLDTDLVLPGVRLSKLFKRG
jgi:hypothetical protein